ncbi:MAG: hydroxymethylbilane synthase [Methanophagales archaeon]|nr:hydroxymethylbilane synthase [Methanophagales archaeon]MCW3137109.1 hydroxymethylbilane synthase [Methanophagales archaeon]MCW3139775.1 hydroxymethylbilane synthase [Methanophagales archaeon]MCW7073433.1 hydroxymethylbilane synthase [Methanophagales archaeon]
MIIGTRGSKLARLQTEKVCGLLRELGIEYKIKIVRSSGDVMLNRSLYEMPDKGVFVKELDVMLLEGKIDIAVHSMKDIPLERDERLETAAVLPRDSPFDALVSDYNLSDMPEGAVIGTSSVRRRFQMQNYMEERGIKIRIKDIRGNVDTRLRKLASGDYTGVLLAEAGLERLQSRVNYERLDRDPFVPSPNQGIIAVVARKDSKESELLHQIEDVSTRIEADVENEVLKVIGGGCALPVGVHASCVNSSVGLSIYIGYSSRSYILKKTALPNEGYLEAARKFAIESIDEGLKEQEQW